MIKSPASFYKPGRRGREWLKLKRAIATLDVVVTAVKWATASAEICFPITPSLFAVPRKTMNCSILARPTQA